MDKLIPLVNNLQDVFNKLGLTFIDLPQIAVVGSQSSGKSSVLENIVGIDFLPRGSGIVTRRPLVLQLRNLPNATDGEWGEFLHVPAKKYYNFEEVREEIVRDTSRLTGTMGISPQPISLKIFSPNVLDLTLIDLPGITKVPVGDQPADIEFQIRNMVNSFIEKRNCIILAVTAANTDLANSDAIQLAKSADPEGERTIGVITKLDLMDAGTDASDILSGKVVNLRRGFIGVVNRSQKAINERMSMQAARQNEMNYFRSHPTYAQMTHVLGTQVLSSTLNKMLIQHIQICLPDIRKSVDAKLLSSVSELESLGGPLQSMSDKKAMLVSILNGYSKEFRNALEGKSVDMNIKELYGGARIGYIFREIFIPKLLSIDPCEGLKDEDIRNAVRNSTGVGNSLFLPRVVNSVIQRQLTRLKDPCLECNKYVLDELTRISTTVGKKHFLRFEELRTALLHEVAKFLASLHTITSNKITSFLEIQLAYINLDHPDCVDEIQAMAALDGRKFKEKKTLTSTVTSLLPNSAQSQNQLPQLAPTVGGVSGNLKSGYLHKQGATMKAWKKRYFNFDGVYLLYFNSDAKGEKARGQIHMRNAVVKPLDPKQFEGWCFSVKVPDKLLILKAEGQKEMQDWILALQSGALTSPKSDEEPNSEKPKENGEEPPPPPKKPERGAPPPPPKDVSKRSNKGPAQKKKPVRRRGGGLLNRYVVPDELEVHLPEVPYSIRPPVNAQERAKCELVKMVLMSYFDVVRKIIRDAVPKSIMVFLVNKSKEDLQFTLGTLFGSQSLDELLKESGAVAAQRQQLDEAVKALRKAVKILKEVENLPLENMASGKQDIPTYDMPATPGSMAPSSHGGPSFSSVPPPPPRAEPPPSQWAANFNSNPGNNFNSNPGQGFNSNPGPALPARGFGQPAPFPPAPMQAAPASGPPPVNQFGAPPPPPPSRLSPPGQLLNIPTYSSGGGPADFARTMSVSNPFNPNAPPQQGFAPSSQQGFAPSPQQGFAPPPQQGYPASPTRQPPPPTQNPFMGGAPPPPAQAPAPSMFSVQQPNPASMFSAAFSTPPPPPPQAMQQSVTASPPTSLSGFSAAFRSIPAAPQSAPAPMAPAPAQAPAPPAAPSMGNVDWMSMFKSGAGAPGSAPRK